MENNITFVLDPDPKARLYPAQLGAALKRWSAERAAWLLVQFWGEYIDDYIDPAEAAWIRKAQATAKRIWFDQLSNERRLDILLAVNQAIDDPTVIEPEWRDDVKGCVCYTLLGFTPCK